MKGLLVLLVAILLPCSMSAAPNDTGIEGVIYISPAHGGPIRINEDARAPVPNLAFVVKQADNVVASFTTDEHGAFRVTLPPGDYKIARKETPGGIGKFEAFEVKVTPGEMKKVEWMIDSGLH